MLLETQHRDKLVGCESGAVDTARKQGTVNVTVLFHFLKISGLPLSHHLSEESTQEMECSDCSVN